MLVVIEHTGTGMDGRWYEFPEGASDLHAGGYMEMVPTGEYRSRDDGERAEVYVPKAYWEGER